MSVRLWHTWDESKCCCLPSGGAPCGWLIRTDRMKSTKVQNPRRILHILRSMPMRVHRACAGFGQKLYACALFIIDGLGHATWSSKTPVSRSGTEPF